MIGPSTDTTESLCSGRQKGRQVDVCLTIRGPWKMEACLFLNAPSLAMD